MSYTTQHTAFRPDKPLLVWDGDCGFCKYWVIRWKKMTGEHIVYRPYQEMLDTIRDIPESEFRKAAQLIDRDGSVHSGAAAAYKALSYAGRWRFLYSMYTSSGLFRSISDRGYRFVANHRTGLYKVTVAMFGKNPARLRYYWAVYALILVLAVVILVYLL